MSRKVLLLLAAGVCAAAGCTTTTKIPDGRSLTPPGLLIGPQATAEAPPPIELPAKEAARVCLRTAQELEKGGSIPDAIRLYEKARTNDPALAATASRRLAVLYDRAGDFTKSAAEYDTLLQARPKDADLLNDVGYSHYCRGDWATAETFLTRAVEADPDHKRAWMNLGLAQAQQEKWDQGFRSFCKAVRPADAHCNLAFVLAARGKAEQAKGQYRQALALDPGLRVARSALAMLEDPRSPEERTAKKVKRNPGEPASRVPSFAEIEARLAKNAEAPIVIPAVGEERNP